MNDTNESEYPHWREALFGNGHVANAWCALKYVAWHTAHVLLAVLVMLFVVPWKLFDGIGDRITVPARLSMIAGAVKVKMPIESLKKAGVLSITIGIGLVIIGAIGFYIWYLVTYPVETLVGVGVLTHIAVGAWIVNKILESYWFEEVTETARSTPGVRRVYGYCPVDTSIEPRWFENLTEKLI